MISTVATIIASSGGNSTSRMPAKNQNNLLRHVMLRIKLFTLLLVSGRLVAMQGTPGA